MTALEFL